MWGYPAVRPNRGEGPHQIHRQGFLDLLAPGILASGEVTVPKDAKYVFPKEEDPVSFDGAVLELEAKEREDVIVVESIDDFRTGAQQLRDLVRAWRIVSGEVPAEAFLDEWESPLWLGADSGEQLPISDPLNEDDIALLLVWALAGPYMPALGSFFPHLIFGDQDPFGRLFGGSLYNMLALELFNHIVGLPYRRCANDACPRLFVRQRGRALHGQHRTRGVKYCSVECARAQTQRAYRRRKRAAATS